MLNFLMGMVYVAFTPVSLNWAVSSNSVILNPVCTIRSNQKLLKIQILRQQPRPIKSESLGVDPDWVLFFFLPKWFHSPPMSGNKIFLMLAWWTGAPETHHNYRINPAMKTLGACTFKKHPQLPLLNRKLWEILCWIIVWELEGISSKIFTLGSSLNHGKHYEFYEQKTKRLNSV